ncbi:hypothetical protein PFISCL1PPCAC_26771, partial [Pristionchus fissidentatus]
ATCLLTPSIIGKDESTNSAPQSCINLVFIAKSKGRIGVIAALNMDNYSADVLQYVNWPTERSSKDVALHAELIKHEPRSEFNHVLTVRLYALKKRSGFV